MVKTPVFEQLQSTVKAHLELLLIECNKQLTESVEEIHDTVFGPLHFYINSKDNKPYVYMFGNPYDEKFVINGITYKNLSAEIQFNWNNDFYPLFRFSKVDSWDGKRYDDSPTEAARKKVLKELTPLCEEVYNRLSQSFDKYLDRAKVLDTKNAISKMIYDLDKI